MPKKAAAAGGAPPKKKRTKSPEKEKPRTIRLAAKLPVLRDARQLRVCCAPLPPRLPTSQFADPVVVLEVSSGEDYPFRRLGTTELLDPWLSEKDEEMMALEKSGVSFGDRISVRHENDAQWTNASFTTRVAVAWRANNTARLRARLYYMDAENGPQVGDEDWLDAADLIAEAVVPLSKVIKHGKNSRRVDPENPEGGAPTIVDFEPALDSEGEPLGHPAAMLTTLDGTRSTVSIHAEKEEEGNKGGLSLNPYCVAFAANEGEAELIEIGRTEVNHVFK